MANNFKKAYKQIESMILGDSSLLKSVNLIALLGSVANKEELIGWSDLDVLVVLKSDKLGNIPMNLLEKLQKISFKVSKKYKFPISILTHTINDFEKYVSFEYLKHYSFGQCTYPNATYLKKKIKGILNRREVNINHVRAYCVYHIRHIRFNLLRKYVSLNEFNSSNCKREFVKLLIDKMIKATDLALNYKDIWPRTKQEILNKSKTNLELDISPLVMALEISSKWLYITDKELELFESIGLRYFLDIIDLVLDDYQKSTPEERMLL